jgi:preprotein translocase subunit YajC
VGVGARVRTTAGVYGTIVSADNDDVMLEVAPGVQIKMMRRAIMNTVPDDASDGMSQTTFSDGSAADGSVSSDNHEDFKI